MSGSGRDEVRSGSECVSECVSEVVAPPLLLGVLVQVLVEATKRRLRALLHHHMHHHLTHHYQHRDSEGCSEGCSEWCSEWCSEGDGAELRAECQVLLELLESSPSHCHTHSHTHAHSDSDSDSGSGSGSASPGSGVCGRGYPDSSLVKLCSGLCECAAQPQKPFALPEMKLEGVQEKNLFSEEEDPGAGGALRQEIARVVMGIDDEIDLMNTQECTAVPGLESLYSFLWGCFSSTLTQTQTQTQSQSQTQTQSRSRPLGATQCVSLVCEGGDASEEKESVILSCLVTPTPTTCSSSSSSSSSGAPAPQTGVPVKVKLPLVCITQVTHLLKRLGRRRLLYLAGLRCTTGSLAAHCPPSRKLLVDAFSAPNLYIGPSSKHSSKSNSILTVGARALCKHAPRSSGGFWTRGNGNSRTEVVTSVTPLTGSEAVKNEKAAAKLKELLDNCEWVNVHQILDAGTGRGGGSVVINADDNHDSKSVPTSTICVLEIRVAEGYGARWGWREPAESSFEDIQRRFEQWQERRQKGHNSEGEDGNNNKNDIAADSSLELTFRGFVEPMSTEGHAKKWRH